MSFKSPFVIKDRHAQDFLRQLFYWRSLYYRKKTHKEIERVNLGRLQQTLTKKSWQSLVLIAGNIYFDRFDLGNNIPGKATVSGWKRRETPYVNKQVEKLINQMHHDNIESVKEMWSIMRQKADVEVTVTTKITYKDEDVAKLVEELMKAAQETAQ